jgi:hypothetical protein
MTLARMNGIMSSLGLVDAQHGARFEVCSSLALLPSHPSFV